MAKFRVLVVDDQSDRNAERFRRLLEHESFEYVVATGWDDFMRRFLEVDAIVVDINLDEWGKTLDEALEVIGSARPVFLASQYWDENRTHQRISVALANAKRVRFAGTLVLNDLGLTDWDQHAVSMRSQMTIAIARSRNQGRLEVGDDAPLNILHVSDPQYGDPEADRMSVFVEKEIPRFILGELQLQIHFILITGDITYSGHPSEFERARERLGPLVKAFLGPSDWRERLMLVPGNHDVNLRLTAADQVEYRFLARELELLAGGLGQSAHRKFALASFREFAWQLTGNREWREAQDLCWINDSFRHLGLRFYLLNTAGMIDCVRPSHAEISIETMRRLLEPRATNDEIFGIALSHHGPPVGDGTSVQTIDNWRETARLFQNTPIRLLVHGHAHKRHADILPLNGDPARAAAGKLRAHKDVLRVMAPTTHMGSTLRPDRELRGFNTITLNRHNGRVESVDGTSYELGDDVPHVTGRPWTVYV